MKKFKPAICAIIAASVLAPCVRHARAQETDLQQGEAFVKTLMQKRDARMRQLYQDLNLADEQKKLLEENKNKSREQMVSLRRQMREKMTMIRQELQKNDMDMAVITRINNELKVLQSDILDRRLESILGVRKILTPEQFKKFTQNMEEGRNRLEGMREGRHPRPEGE